MQRLDLIVFILGLGPVLWGLRRLGLERVLWATLLFAAGTLLSSVAVVGGDRLLGLATENLWWRLALALLLGLGGYYLAVAWGRRLIRRREWDRRLAASLAARPGWRRGAWGLTFLIYGGTWALLAPVAATFGQTVVLLAQGQTPAPAVPPAPPPTPGPAPETPLPPPASAAPDSGGGGFFGTLQAGLEKSRQALAEGTGAAPLIRAMNLVQELQGMDTGEAYFLCETTPELAWLMDHPRIQALVANDSLLEQVNQVSQGSLTALYKLGENPDILAILRDPEIMAKANAIDLEALRRRVQERRRQSQPLPVAEIELAAFASPGELPSTWHNQLIWQRWPGGAELFAWRPGTPWTAARLRVAVPRATPVTLDLGTPGTPSLRLNDQPVPLAPGRRQQHARFVLPPGDNTLLLIVGFTAPEQARGCQLDLRVDLAATRAAMP